ncbi:hypothetical protein [Streptomyces flavidovirens]|uniref:hypothetical protein n=1 Tax=Streptomyces flavidovirens TaxID=67298 RepID=UPI0036B29E28
MPESNNPTLQAQYANQVDADLEHNTKEQERVRSEVAALQAQLEALEKDHELLVSMRAALGTTPAKKTRATRTTSTAKAAPAAKTVVPRARRAKATSDNDKPSRKTAQPDTGAKANKATPPLRELVVAVLAKHDEPRSAAEVTQELAQAHPERTLSVTVVRNALEASVAKNQSERTKQQKSVYYRVVKDGQQAAQQPAAAPSTAGV